MGFPFCVLMSSPDVKIEVAAIVRDAPIEFPHY